jgi:hypothetical protein
VSFHPMVWQVVESQRTQVGAPSSRLLCDARWVLRDVSTFSTCGGSATKELENSAIEYKNCFIR